MDSPSLQHKFVVQIDDCVTYDIEVFAMNEEEAEEIAWDIFSTESCPQHTRDTTWISGIRKD